MSDTSYKEKVRFKNLTEHGKTVMRELGLERLLRQAYQDFIRLGVINTTEALGRYDGVLYSLKMDVHSSNELCFSVSGEGPDLRDIVSGTVGRMELEPVRKESRKDESESRFFCLGIDAFSGGY